MLFLNLDETSIPATMQGLPGCVAMEGQKHRMAVRKEDLRGSFTYVSLICDSVAIQPLLPHYLLCSEAKLSKKLLKGQRALPQTCLRVVRQKSAWASKENLKNILKDVADLLTGFPLQPILLLDVASAHITKDVMIFARKMKIQLLYVPAGCTDKLQPLDLQAFASFKTYLKGKYQALRLGNGAGPQPLEWIYELMQCPRMFFASKKWKHSFEAVGSSLAPEKIHRSLAEYMDHPKKMPEGLKPSAADLLMVFPTRRRMAYAPGALL